MILEFFIKWGLGIITGVLTTVFLVFRKEFVEYIKYKRGKQKKEFLKEVDQEMENLEEKMESYEENMQHQDTAYLQKLGELEEKIMKILVPIQEATLSSHYQALLEKCKHYVRQEYITADELDLLEKDYDTYHSLGGNGHMEIWMSRIRQLPVK